MREPRSRPRDPSADEDALLDALARGERRAAEELAERTYSRIYAALVKLTGGDRDLAADLTQETYRRAWRALHTFHRRSSFFTWLYRVAYTTFLNHIRRPQAVQPLDDTQAEGLEACEPGQDERLDRREVAERLRRAVMALPEDLRFTVTARFWGDLPVSDIARMENVSGAAIRKRLKNATARLRLALEEDAA
ncbi:MAG: sigma-70 family RNA polymerase sigma factor [Holophagales bacterium]|nr:sigma-70 family RNA polymerase sigma factor [Holophagales bacterium]